MNEASFIKLRIKVNKKGLKHPSIFLQNNSRMKKTTNIKRHILPRREGYPPDWKQNKGNEEWDCHPE